MAQGDDSKALSRIKKKVKRLALEASRSGHSLHILGDSTVISFPKSQQPASTINGGNNQLLEGPGALRYLMNAQDSDCILITPGSQFIHAKQGK